MEQSGAFGSGMVFGQPLECVVHDVVREGHLVRREVAFKHAAVRAELLDTVVHPGQKTLAIEPDHIGARLGLGSAYAKLTKNEMAIEEYKKVAKARPTDPEIPFKIALEYWYIQDIPSAAEFYKKVIDIKPDHLQAHLNLASVYERMEDWQKAIREIEIAKRLGEETGNPQAIAIAEKKLPFIQSRMNVTQPDIKRKSEPPLD